MVAVLTQDKHGRMVYNSAEAVPEKLVLLLGMPRSGTSWLGKIFDSHPAVIYRHEPDAVLRNSGLPAMCPIEEIPRYAEAARNYVLRLTAVRQVKTSGTR